MWSAAGKVLAVSDAAEVNQHQNCLHVTASVFLSHTTETVVGIELRYYIGQYHVVALLILGAHVQRGLRYLVCVLSVPVRSSTTGIKQAYE